MSFRPSTHEKLISVFCFFRLFVACRWTIYGRAERSSDCLDVVPLFFVFYSFFGARFRFFFLPFQVESVELVQCRAQ